MQGMPFALPKRPKQRGVALFIVIVFVMLSMLLALWASRTSLFNELLVGNDADYQRAFEAAQALLQDAELDIRRENADGSACITLAPPNNARCRDLIGAAPKIPVVSSEARQLLDDLDLQPTKCNRGLCTKRLGRQDFWNYTNATTPAPTGLQPGEVKLDDMTQPNVGARYGEFTGATVGSSSNPANPILTDTSANNRGGWYWIEVLPYDESSKSKGLIVNPAAAIADNLLKLNLVPNVVYRITAVAYGRKPGTMAVLQQTYARQVHKGDHPE
jgi:type IV pilus assembly protein PilX